MNPSDANDQAPADPPPQSEQESQPVNQTATVQNGPFSFSKTAKYILFGPPPQWLFGVVTCIYYAIASVAMCSMNSDYLQVIVAPLLVIGPCNAITLWMLRDNNKVLQHKALLGTVNNFAFLISGILFVILLPLIGLDLAGCCLCFSGALGSASNFFGPRWYEPLQIFGICIFYLYVAISPFATAIAQRRKFHRGFDNPDKKGWLYLYVPTSPFATAIAQRRKFHRGFDNPDKKGWLSLSACAAFTLAAVLVVLFPATMTLACTDHVMRGSKIPESLLLLRAFGNNEELLRLCYNERHPLPWFFQIVDPEEFIGGKGGSLDKAREIYYRVTGHPFNGVPRTKHLRMYMTPFDLFGSSNDDYDYDGWRLYSNDFAGDAVGGVERGLSLVDSSIVGWIDADDAVSNMSWQMKFNSEQYVHEFRAQILLPQGAVVNRCTLTIDGVEREAIYAARHSTRAAYVDAATSGERPLLVSTAGAGRVLVQSSTGWWKDGAKLKIEFAAPLTIDTPGQASIQLPRIAERDFQIKTAHSILVRTYSPITKISQPLPHAARSLSGSLSNEQLSAGCSIQLSRDPSRPFTVTDDLKDEKGALHQVVSQIKSRTGSADTPTYFVIDGSTMMEKWLPRISSVLEHANFRHATIIWGSDKPSVVTENVDTHSDQWKSALARLEDSSALGGQNNAEVLKLALGTIPKGTRANIVWLHGPQPVKFTGDDLVPILQKNKKLDLFEYQCELGPNEVIRSLDSAPNVIQVTQTPDTRADLSALDDRLSGARAEYYLDLHEVTAAAVAQEQQTSQKHAKNSKEIADVFWARETVRNGKDTAATMVRYGTVSEKRHLVTPLTSALVLEKGDYAERKVLNSSGQVIASKPSSASSALALGNLSGLVPVTPEPPIWMLLLAAAPPFAFLLWLRKRRCIGLV